MDIFAEVIQNGNRTGLIGYCATCWGKAGGDLRLVFKLFNETLNWRATMDLMIRRSLQRRNCARAALRSPAARSTPSRRFIVYLERSATSRAASAGNSCFFHCHRRRAGVHPPKRDLIDFGGDFTLYDEHDRTVGRLDGQVFSIGGKWKGRVARRSRRPRCCSCCSS